MYSKIIVKITYKFLSTLLIVKIIHLDRPIFGHSNHLFSFIHFPLFCSIKLYQLRSMIQSLEQISCQPQYHPVVSSNRPSPDLLYSISPLSENHYYFTLDAIPLCNFLHLHFLKCRHLLVIVCFFSSPCPRCMRWLCRTWYNCWRTCHNNNWRDWDCRRRRRCYRGG